MYQRCYNDKYYTQSPFDKSQFYRKPKPLDKADSTGAYAGIGRGAGRNDAVRKARGTLERHDRSLCGNAGHLGKRSHKRHYESRKAAAGRHK